MSNSTYPKLNFLLKRLFLLISGLSVLSGSFVLAQENTESPSETTPNSAPAEQPQLSAPKVSVPSQPPVNAVEVIPAPETQPKVNSNNHNYIDPTPYNVQASPRVIFETRNQNSNNINSDPTAIKPKIKPQTLRVNNSNNINNLRENQAYVRKNQANSISNHNSENPKYSYKYQLNSDNNNQINSQTTVYNRATRVIKKYIPTNTSLLFPLSIPAPITSAFGWRIHPISGTARMHTGTDIGAPTGTPVLAAYQGRVETAGNLGGYGLTVTILHENDSQESLYGHLSQILVQSGQWVEQGTVIGLVGSTGNSTGPHLHFEWRHRTLSGWVAVDAGDHLRLAMEALVNSMEVASSNNNNSTNENNL